MQISRHFVDIGARRVHYRRYGVGLAPLMVHQSPRSSAEYDVLMREWGANFTCIAPDTPGFGQSDPLPEQNPTIDDFADAIVALIDVLEIGPVAAYGFHSGGVIPVTALKRHPGKFRALAVGDEAIWPPEGRPAWQAFIDAAAKALYACDVMLSTMPTGAPDLLLPDLMPDRFGSHLTRAWANVGARKSFNPWYEANAAAAQDFAPATIAPAALAREHRALIQAGSARDYLVALRSREGES